MVLVKFCFESIPRILKKIKVMTGMLDREVDCILCQELFSPVIEPEEGEEGYSITCSSSKCSNGVFISCNDPVRTALRATFRIRGEALALALEEALADCPCGESFRHDAGKRCLNCVEKIQKQVRTPGPTGQHLLWNREALFKHEQRFIGHVMEKTEEAETLNDLVELFESRQIGSEEYMERLDLLQNREGVLLSVLKTWAIALGPQMAFRAAADLDLVDQFGTRVLITIASGLSIGTGQSLLVLLSKEAGNWDGEIEKELRTYIGKIGGS